MKESDVLSFLDDVKPAFEILTNQHVNPKNVVSFTVEVFKRGEFIQPGPSLNSEEFVAAATLIALLSHEEGKLDLCGEAYEVLVYLCLKSDNHPQVNKFLHVSIDALPAEVFEGILRGLSTYDQETKTDTGKRLLRNALQGRTVTEITEQARWRTFDYKVQHIWNKIKNPILGSLTGWIVGQILASIFFTQ